jgi:hypothetical protein
LGEGEATMMYAEDWPRPEHDVGDVRRALRMELERRGHVVASDTLSFRRELYIIGAGDVAQALFEIKGSVLEAMDTMYQGSWVEGLPPRFAVLPATARHEASWEILAQIRIVPVLYETGEDGIVFPDLGSRLREHLPPTTLH